MNQKVINFVNKLKNNSLVNRKSVTFTYSELIIKYVDCLYREGFIQSYDVTEVDDQKKINILIRIENGQSLTSNLKIVSSLTKKRYLTANNLYKINVKKSELFLSTSSGILSLSECKKKNVGGLVVFAC